MRCAHQACSLGRCRWRSGAGDNERDVLGSHSFPLSSLRVRSLGADPLALLPLDWPVARWPTVPRAGRPAGVAPCKGAVACAALRLREADRLRSFDGAGTPRALPSRFPKQNSRPRVAVAARPLARARASIQLTLPLPSSPEGRAACRKSNAALPEGDRKCVI